MGTPVASKAKNLIKAKAQTVSAGSMASTGGASASNWGDGAHFYLRFFARPDHHLKINMDEEQQSQSELHESAKPVSVVMNCKKIPSAVVAAMSNDDDASAHPPHSHVWPPTTYTSRQPPSAPDEPPRDAMLSEVRNLLLSSSGISRHRRRHGEGSDYRGGKHHHRHSRRPNV
jgi:hypothetical protein